MTIEYTINRDYPKPDFDTRTWHDQMHRSLDMIDADMQGGFTPIPSTDGSLLTFLGRFGAVGADIPAEVLSLQTAGYATQGDGGGALYYKVGASTPGGFQSHDGAWWALEKGDINVRQYGAVGNGVGDDTAAIRLAALAFKAAVYNPPGGSGGPLVPSKIVFPAGVYKITGSIDLQQLTAAISVEAVESRWEIDMRGAVLQCAYAGGTIFDCLGSSWGTFRGGCFYGSFTSIPAIGIQIGRLAVGDTGGGFIFDGVSFTGKWSRSCIYNTGSETNTYLHLGIYNWDTNGAAIILDGCNHLGPITDFLPTTLPVDTHGSCIQNIFFGGQFASRYGAPAVIDLYDISQVHFYGAYGLGTGIIVRNTAIGAVGASVNDHRYDIHCELNTINVEFRRLNSVGTFTVHGLYLNDNGAQASAAIINIGTNVSSLNIFDGEFHTAFTTTALFSSAAYVLGGMVMGNNVGVLQIGDGSTSLNTGTGSLGRRGTISKVALVAALTAPRVLTLPPASDLPRGWRLEIVDTAGGLSATNTLSVTRAGADTINGAALAIVMRHPYDGIVLMTDGVSKWTFPRTVFDEGTFVPAFSATGCTFSYSLQSGTFTRNGRVVTFDLVLILNTSGNILTANPLTITGLPFTALANSVCVVQWNASTATYVNVSALMSGATIILRGATVAATSNANALNADALLHATNGSSLRISGSYTV